MSQSNVERVVGQLATDEGMRRRFTRNPRAALEEMVGRGVELTECERWALSRLDPHDLERFAESMDARLQKTDLEKTDLEGDVR
jgi:cobalamin biosynthesis Mg chelatase CobN